MSIRESFRRLSPMEWSCLVAFSVASPFVFVLVTGYAARFVAPALSAIGVSSPTQLFVALFVLNVLGAIVAAAIVGLPLGWLAPKRSALFGAIVGLVGVAGVLWFGRSVSSHEAALWALRVAEVVAFAGGCILFAVAVAAGTHRVAA